MHDTKSRVVLVKRSCGLLHTISKGKATIYSSTSKYWYLHEESPKFVHYGSSDIDIQVYVMRLKTGHVIMHM